MNNRLSGIIHRWPRLYGCGILLLLSGAVSRAAITTVDPWHTAGNGNLTDFGGPWYSVPNVVLNHLTRDGFGAGAFTGRTVIYGLGFSDLQGVSYTGAAVGNVSILPVRGWTGGVSFYGFDLGVWQSPPLTRDVRYEVWNGDFSALMSSGTVNVGATRATVNVPLFSANGFQLQFESARQVALDNYRVEGNDSALPKPLMGVSGNGAAIASGDTSPAVLDGTDFGIMAGGMVTRTFTITNTGVAPLQFTGAAPHYVALSGAPDFTIASQPAATVNVGGGTTVFTVTFQPTGAGVKNAVASIAYNDPARNPYTFALTARAVSFTEDSDGDGMSDGAEFQMAALGFNWQVPQSELVTTYYGAAPSAGFHTLPELQSQQPGVPLAARDPLTGLFGLTLRAGKSTTLLPGSFSLVPATPPQTVFDSGNILFDFPGPDPRSFFRIVLE